jgi:hypothetical protein
MARIKRQPSKEPPIPGTARPAHDAIVDLTDAFCREHLNEEYEAMCRRLAGVLARKRPSPLVSGKPETWACGIVRTIGWVNFLDDSSRKPHMKMTTIDEAFGVGESTGPGKSKAIRTMLTIRQLDHRWMLASRMESRRYRWRKRNGRRAPTPIWSGLSGTTGTRSLRSTIKSRTSGR